MVLDAKNVGSKPRKFHTPVKRLRIIAGPNGSGKTTLFNEVRRYLGQKIGIWINADEIQREISNTGRLSLESYGIVNSEEAFKEFVQNLNREEFNKNHFVVQENTIVYLGVNFDNSYEASVLAEFIRESLLEQGQSMVFETVMSHVSKIHWMQKAKAKGYKIYLYYIATNSADIQKSRVKGRVMQNGHDVAEDKIEARYFRSLDLAMSALTISDRAWFIDNTSDDMQIVAELNDDREIIIEQSNPPAWFLRVLYGE